MSISRNIPRIARLTVLHIQGGDNAYAFCLYEGLSIYYYPSSLKKRENSVGSVGSVGKSEKSPQKIL